MIAFECYEFDDSLWMSADLGVFGYAERIPRDATWLELIDLAGYLASRVASRWARHEEQLEEQIQMARKCARAAAEIQTSCWSVK